VTELRTVADLRERYTDPGARGQAKVIGALDDNCRAFLSRCPFFVLASADASGRSDASPRGGGPGFLHVLDDHHVAWADLSGNNRLDSFQNLVANPGVGLLCMIPGLDETLRINGRATLSTDPELCAAIAIDEGKPAKVAVVVEVEEAYIHCAKAFRRGGMWKPEQWPDRTDMPTIACMLRDHVAVDITAEAIDEGLETNYRDTMWEPGG
jgi:PPOX class probable FMN-dependent enzyme